MTSRLWAVTSGHALVTPSEPKSQLVELNDDLCDHSIGV